MSSGIFWSSSSRSRTDVTSRPRAKSAVSASMALARPSGPGARDGAILLLAKPENRQRLPFFAGIKRVRFRRPVHPGDVLVVEANVVRLRTRMGVLRGIARVNGKIVCEGTMTFALGDPQS